MKDQQSRVTPVKEASAEKVLKTTQEIYAAPCDQGMPGLNPSRKSLFLEPTNCPLIPSTRPPQRRPERPLSAFLPRNLNARPRAINELAAKRMANSSDESPRNGNLSEDKVVPNGKSVIRASFMKKLFRKRSKTPTGHGRCSLESTSEESTGTVIFYLE